MTTSNNINAENLPSSSAALDSDRTPVRNGTVMNISIVIDDLASFNRYVIKEHACSLQANHVAGDNPAESCIVNCLYDELSGWLDNPSMLGFSILSIAVANDKIKDENIELSVGEDKFEVGAFELIKFIGEVAGKNHEIEGGKCGGCGAWNQLNTIRQKARDLLKNLVRIS